MVEALGWAAFVGGLVGTLVLMADRGFHDGLRLAWFLATLAVPGWFNIIFRSIGLDAVTGVATATLIALMGRPFAGARTTWVLTDLLLGTAILSAILSDALNRILIPGTVFEQVRTWVFPYLIGRLFLTCWNDMRRTLPTVVVLAAALSLFGLVEAVTRVNVLAKATGMSWELLEKSEGFRWGLKRAQGITNHPIYFGLLLALTLPWVLTAVRVPLRPAAPRWWKFVPALMAAAAVVTVSRSAQIAIVIVVAADLFFRRPAARPIIILIVLIGGLTFAVFREQVIDLLGAYAGETDPSENTILINGVEYEYTGTRHRDLLYLAYGDLIDRAPWYGYGTVSDEVERQVEQMPVQFKSIDNHYLVQYLRYGIPGIVTFLLFGIAAAWNLAREAWARDGPLADLSAGLFGASVAVLVMLRGVALSPDFGFTWLFVAGLAASIRARRLAPVTAVSPQPYDDGIPAVGDRRPQEAS
jgi:hypothetical protein